jgi:hypothetical protein
MKPKQILDSLPDDVQEIVQQFVTTKAHPDEIGPNETLKISTKGSKLGFDEILLERERRIDENDASNTLQETAIVGINKQPDKDDIVTFIGAWSPETFANELNQEMDQEIDTPTVPSPKPKKGKLSSPNMGFV